MVKSRDKQIKPGSEGQILKTVSGVATWAAEAAGAVYPISPDKISSGTDGYVLKTVSGTTAWAAETVTSSLPTVPNSGDYTLEAIDGSVLWIATVPSGLNIGLGAFVGSGIDGYYSASSGTLTLNSDKYYSTIVLSGTAKIDTNGYKLSCLVFDATNAGVAAINCNGNNGVNATPGSQSGIGGAARTSGTLGKSTSGSTGGGPASGVGQSQISTPTTSANSDGGAGGSAGTGGTGSAGAGGAGGSGGLINGFTPIYNWTRDLFTVNSGSFAIINGGAGGAGGSSGGGSLDGHSSGSGGGGGSGGGVIWFCAGEIITGASTPSGVIQVIGGNGGNAALPVTLVGNLGGASGGAGGGGGFLYAAVGKVTGPKVTNFFDASGGTAGTAAAGNGTGTTAGASSGGQGGTITLLYLNGVKAYSVSLANAIGTAGGISKLDLDPSLAS